MADLSEIESSLSVKLAGATPSGGAETFYQNVDSNGNAFTVVNNASGASAVNIQDGGNSITVDATSLPLPTGAATSTLQTTGNTSLASIDTKTPTVGQKTMANSSPVVIASDQSAIPVSQSGTWTNRIQDSSGNTLSSNAGSLFVVGGDSAGSFNSGRVLTVQGAGIGSAAIQANVTSSVLPTGAATEATLATRLADATFTNRINTLGQKTMANSTPVVLASDQSTLNVNGTLTGTISTANSSTVNIAANGTFIGTGEDVSNYSYIGIQIFTNQASAALGFKPQYSIDNVNWDDGDSYTIPVSDGKFFTFPIQAQYFRLNYTNGAVATTVFRLQTIFHRAPIKPSSHRIGDAIDDENDAELVKANLTGRTAAGSYINLEATVNNELNVADILDNSGTQGTVSVTTSATAIRVGGSNLANRKILTAYNDGTAKVYWGYTNAVTTSTGTPLERSQFNAWTAGPNTTIFMIAATGSQTIRVTEGA